MNKDLTIFSQNHVKQVPINSEYEIKLFYCKISSICDFLFEPEKYPYNSESYNIVRNIKMNRKDFLISFLSDSEIDTLNNFKSFKKQIEWLAGRLLLKTCLSSFKKNIGALEDIKVAYKKEGAPFLPNFPDIKISLSHSGNIALFGLCEEHNIGVDVEKLKSKPGANFLKIAFTQDEISSMDDTREEIFKKWTIKEAFLKYIRKGFNESLHKVEVIDNRILHGKLEAQVNVFSKIIDGSYVLSVVSTRPESQ